MRIGSALLISGAIGNGIDRYVLHGVVDFFDFRIWPIFNVADIWYMCRCLHASYIIC